MTGRGRAFGLVTIAYLVGLLAAVVTGRALDGAHPLVVIGAADLVGTLVVFRFSVAFDNSSFYDPYWSVAPVPIAVYWMLQAAPGTSALRGGLVLALVCVWGARLTWNWARGWTGLRHEDWRYVDLRAQTGRGYWAVSFLGLHLFPTVIVFLGCLPLQVGIATGTRPFGVLDLVAAAVTGGAILLEATADAQLRRFRLRGGPGGTLRSGLWARSRHPNYLGEMSFWWGLFLFALAAEPAAWWTGVGALAITVMFLVVSIPMLDRRMLARRPDYARTMEEIPALVPRLGR
jgi:steroid 5-alpha reductase family enzyme